MKVIFQRWIRNFRKDERGQALPFVALMLVTMMGMTGMVVDVGRVLYIHRQLQTATDSAALAGGNALPGSNATAVATQYSAVTGDLNARSSLSGATMVSGYPKVVCLNTLTQQGIACTAPSNANAIVVKQQVTINLTFLRMVGQSTLTIGATATAAARGGTNPTPYNVAIIVDTTLSMNATDTNCNNITQMQCALNGVQVLLKALSPCAAIHTTCTTAKGVATDPVDQVALFTFPNVTVGTAAINTNCTTGITQSAYNSNSRNGYYYSSNTYGYYNLLPGAVWSGLATATGYTYPSATATSYAPSGSTTGTYQVTPYLSDYRSSDTASTLNASSDVVQAAGGASNCGALAPPNYDGDYGTYYAGAIYAAQASLVAQKAAYPGSANMIILLSDGDATAPQKSPNPSSNGVTYYAMPSPAGTGGTYPSYVNECQQGVTAATAATNAGTRVYTVAYGSPTATSSCSTDTGNSLTACTAMTAMASSAATFYSDYNQSGSTGKCYSTHTVTSLADIFTSIAADLTVSRLIPDNTT
jgi:hypothetical protein